MPRLKRFFDYLVPAVLYAGLIFFLSSRSHVPSLPGTGSDKVAHFFEYGVLGILVVRAVYAYGVQQKRALAWGVLICMVYGAADEIHQLFTPGRASEIWDFVADAVGSTSGGLLWYTVGSHLWGFETKPREP